MTGNLINISLTLAVHDRTKLLNYARANALAWGFDEAEFAGDDDQTLALAAYETVVLHAPQPCLVALDAEIVDPTAAELANSEAVSLLRRLWEWDRGMGRWEAQVWRDVEQFLGIAPEDKNGTD